MLQAWRIGEATPDKPYPPTWRKEGTRCFFQWQETRDWLASVCESPIEADFGASFLTVAGPRFDLFPQYKMGRYRYDFAIFKRGADSPVVLIECDGKQFHSTPEQLANDAAKDAAAVAAGAIPLRFTGSEIYRSPEAVVASVLEICKSKVNA